ncbi:MAG: HAMP domain-containing histidine kinase [Bacteroidales bacterium]|jgi:signal transduction histidine kinase|nr:HAMP domain-containing histidine kinase [Bacteroidales bacterium]
MPSIYDTRQKLKILFLFLALLIACIFLYVSHRLVNDLSAEERNKVEIWAEAVRSFLRADPDAELSTLTLSVIESNNTIPVMLLDESDNIIISRNIPELVADNLKPDIAEKIVAKFKKKNRHIPVVIGESAQHLYYDDSVLLKQLSIFPFIELLAISVFFIIAVLALASTKKAEQNQVWVGLSKETAHQLGTPISSLMAWETLLKERYKNDKLLDEMGRDIHRLNTIAERFSKIGSKPELKKTKLQEVIQKTVTYMSQRISGKIHIAVHFPKKAVYVMTSAPLFEWVMENLFKNAVDAMTGGKGNITVSLSCVDTKAVVHVADTGKGLPKNKFKTIFNPGYTTKERGWGLGLSLAKRIIEDYHSGKIYVSGSELNQGTTFCIELSICQS